MRRSPLTDSADRMLAYVVVLMALTIAAVMMTQGGCTQPKTAADAGDAGQCVTFTVDAGVSTNPGF